MTEQEIINYADERMKLFLPSDWNFNIYILVGRWGQTIPLSKSIYFNLLNIDANEGDIKDVINHEIAHALIIEDRVHVHAHGKEWKAKCKIVGCRPKATGRNADKKNRMK